MWDATERETTQKMTYEGEKLVWRGKLAVWPASSGWGKKGKKRNSAL